MENYLLLEALADIAYIAGNEQFYSGDSRFDISEFIYWAQEFEHLNKNTNWDDGDYISSIENFTLKKLKENAAPEKKQKLNGKRFEDLFQEFYLMNDQPMTCPICGNRTEILLDYSEETIQIHKCLNMDCRNIFATIEDI